MAGGFLNIAEAAAHLNISEDAVKQLVDQRKLFSLRDTSGLKFKHEELDRYLEDQKDIGGTDATAPETPESDISLDGLELDISDESLRLKKKIATEQMRTHLQTFLKKSLDPKLESETLNSSLVFHSLAAKY